jgi:hypothetical protein
MNDTTLDLTIKYRRTSWRANPHKRRPPSPTKAQLLLRVPHEARDPFLWIAFPSLWGWQAPQPLYKSHEGKSPGLFTIFHEEVTAAPTAKPTRRSRSKSNKLAVSHSNKS